RYCSIGVLAPNTSAAPTVLLSLWAATKVPAVLNYSTGAVTMLACAQLAGLKRIITSRVFLERTKLNVDSFVKTGIDLIYLEDACQNISDTQTCWMLLRHTLHT